MKTQNWQSILLLLLLAMIWGSSFILIKRGLLYMDATDLGALRVGLTGLALAPFVLRKMHKYSKQELLYLLLSGICGSLGPAILFAWAETKIESSLAGVLNSLTPIFTLVMGLVIFNLKVNRSGIIGIMFGLLGALMLILSQNGGHLSFENIEYAGLAVIAAMLYGVNINLVKKKLQHLPALEITAGSFLLLALPVWGYLVFGGFISHLQEEPNTIIGVAYVSVLALVGTALAYLLFNMVIKANGPIFASSVTYLIPVFAIFWGLLDGETLELSALLWISFIFIGILLINRPSSKPLMAKAH